MARRTSGRSRRRTPPGSCRRRRGPRRATRARPGWRAGPGAPLGGLRAASGGEPVEQARLRGPPDADRREERRAVGRGPVGGERARQLVLGGRLASGWTTRVRSRLRVIASSTGSDCAPSGAGASSARTLVEQRRARLGAAVLVAVAVGEEEPPAGQRQADVEEVALLGVGVAARLQAERGALRFGEERVGAAVAARELAVLQRGDEDVVEAASRAAGRGWRSAPGPRPGRSRPGTRDPRSSPAGPRGVGSGRPVRRAPRAPRRWRPLRAARARRLARAPARPPRAQGPRGHRRRDPADLRRELRRGALGGVAQALQVTRGLAVLALPERQRRLRVLNPAPPQRSLQPVDPTLGEAGGARADSAAGRLPARRRTRPPAARSGRRRPRFPATGSSASSAVAIP